jgi:6-phosphofructokinase 1
MLGSSNVDTRSTRSIMKNGKKIYEDRSDEVVEHLARERIDGVIVIGGDGTQAISHGMSEKGIKVVGIPRLSTTISMARSTRSVFSPLFPPRLTPSINYTAPLNRITASWWSKSVGRDAGWIALFAGLGGDADVILVPEIPYRLENVAKRLNDLYHSAKSTRSSLLPKAPSQSVGT